jgi:hypothetical protein
MMSTIVFLDKIKGVEWMRNKEEELYYTAV